MLAGDTFDPGAAPVSLMTPRLLLRQPRPGDASGLAALADDLRIAVMVERIPHPCRTEDAAAFMRSDGAEIRFTILLPASGALVGLCGLRIDKERESGELGYWLGTAFWGKGYATEAVQTLIDLAFGRLGLGEVVVSCRVVNGPSRRVIQKCGFQFSGTGMTDTVAAGRVAAERYRMDRRCWASLKAWGTR